MTILAQRPPFSSKCPRSNGLFPFPSISSEAEHTKHVHVHVYHLGYSEKLALIPRYRQLRITKVLKSDCKVLTK